MKLLSSIHNILNKLVRYRIKNEIPFALGELENHCAIIVIRLHEEFKNLPLLRKIFHLIVGYSLEYDEYAAIAYRYARDELYGADSEFGSLFFCLNIAKSRTKWDLSKLEEVDREKCIALAGQGEITRRQFNYVIASPSLTLDLDNIIPSEISSFVIPMSSRVLVINSRNFIEINSFYTFAQIRKFSPDNANVLIAYLYDLMLIQQKTALSLLDMHTLIYESKNQRAADKSLKLSKAEIDAIRMIDSSIVYLKASVEKTIALVGAAHGSKDLSSKGKHKKKIEALRQLVSYETQKTPYSRFFFSELESTDYDKLNDYRTGILHKKGYASLQPHAFSSDENPSASDASSAFAFVHYYHRVTSALVLSGFALIVDKMMLGLSKEEKAEEMRELKHLTENMAHVLENFWPGPGSLNSSAKNQPKGS